MDEVMDSGWMNGWINGMMGDNWKKLKAWMDWKQLNRLMDIWMRGGLMDEYMDRDEKMDKWNDVWLDNDWIYTIHGKTNVV